MSLVRTSTVPRLPGDPVLGPVKVHFVRLLHTMTLDWSKEELANERRLVKFSFFELGPSQFSIDFEQILPHDYIPRQPIILCVWWQERQMYIVTSVDIILLMEFLVRQSFSIEEKNRIRRNLQSLKTFTILRLNSLFMRFFNALMSMEDPRPRNIEQDLKVFQWVDLEHAIAKVISKYSMATTPGSQSEFMPNERLRALKRKMSLTSIPRSKTSVPKAREKRSRDDPNVSPTDEVSDFTGSDTDSIGTSAPFPTTEFSNRGSACSLVTSDSSLHRPSRVQDNTAQNPPVQFFNYPSESRLLDTTTSGSQLLPSLPSLAAIPNLPLRIPSITDMLPVSKTHGQLPGPSEIDSWTNSLNSRSTSQEK